MTRVLDAELNKPLLHYADNGTIEQSLQTKIANRLWGAENLTNEKHKASLATYFAHFQTEINLWSAPRQDVAIETYNDFLDLVAHLTVHKDKSRSSTEILKFFPPIESENFKMQGRRSCKIDLPLSERYEFTTQMKVDNAIELTLGLWLMVFMGPTSPSIFLGLGRWHSNWPNDTSLTEMLEKNFEKTLQRQDSKQTQFPKELTAHNLERIGGFRIMWTSSLKNHLAFDENSWTIVLYHFAGALRLHECQENQDFLLPKGLLEETRRTLALLLPQFDGPGKQWFHRASKRANGTLDPTAASQSLGSQGREIQSFEFWHHRLSLILEAFESVEPRGFKAWWFDRRSRVQWINFWIAVTILGLTVLFGFISSITGILQAYFAFKSQHQ